MGRYAGAFVFLFLAALANSAEYTIVDVQKVPATGDASTAIVRATVTEPVPEIACDVLIAGAGMGGVGAALAVSRHHKTACLTEETDWVGGQATAGGVSALDENKFIEISGGTRKYYEFRQGIREASGGLSNPGACYVSALCFEPRVGVSVLNRMLEAAGARLYPRTQVIAIDRKGDRIDSVLVWQFEKKSAIRFRAAYVLDATEMGDLLPLAKIPYVVGSEPKSDTNEPHAAEKANPACVQSFTYPFAIERRDGENNRIAKPADYEGILKRQQFTLHMNYPVEYGWKGAVDYRMYGDDPPIPNNMSPGPFFSWRRIRAKSPEIGLMNWPRQDYAAESILDRTPADLARILQDAKRTSVSFLYWIQSELGHPEVKLRPDIMDTADGLSKYPYVRESRRMLAKGRVNEQDIVDEYWPGPRARWFDDSVGIGFYMVDIHPCGANERGRMMMPKPFQIPLSTLLPQGPVNFLPAGKNIGVTHLTNGAFRLHPIEWMVGEAAGTIASLAIAKGTQPSVRMIQADLAQAGVPIVWFDDLPVDHPAFAAIQLAAIRGIYPLGSDLHASPDAPVSRAEAAIALASYFGEKLDRDKAIRAVIDRGWMATDHRNWFHPDLPLLWTDIRDAKLPRKLPAIASPNAGPVKRSEFVSRLLSADSL
jgi:FAD-dependent oxidoreductase family protein